MNYHHSWVPSHNNFLLCIQVNKNKLNTYGAVYSQYLASLAQRTVQLTLTLKSLNRQWRESHRYTCAYVSRAGGDVQLQKNFS